MKFVGFFTLLLSIYSHSGYAQTAQSASDIVYLTQEENQFYILLNQFRSQLGLPTVQVHVFLQSAAKKHSDWMASQDFLSHFGPANKTPFERMKDEGYINYTSAGENIACGNSDAMKTFRQWALSPSHLENMINPHFKHIGISRAGTGNEQCPFYWTNDFGSITDPNLDPPAMTDIQKIKAAIERISGPLPSGTKVQLPVEQQDVVKDANPTYSLIQCMIPYSLAKNVLSFSTNTDAVMEVSPNDLGGYKAKVSYFQNGSASNFYPLLINNVSVIKNSNYPLILIFAGATNKNAGFMIQLDTTKSSAQFDPYPAFSGTSGLVTCSYKM